ncbi:MAG: tRNA lysidine(34) synthetase TilS [Acidimicrobiales bacterium]
MSGGPDSLALLVLARAAGLDVTAWHVDHGHRPGSGEGEAVVAAAADTVGAAFRAVSVCVEPGPNFEARARRARYGALPDGVLTGHTADDQAETVLLNLMRGAALDGLAGMRPENRPLLALRRHETRAVCAAVGLHPVDDPTNDDPAFRRNRVRHELLPLLDDIAGRDVAPVIARQSALVRDAVGALDTAAATLDPTDGRALAAAPLALARVAVRRWITDETGLGHPVDGAAVERVLAVARGTARGADVVEGWSVRRTDGRLRLVSG